MHYIYMELNELIHVLNAVTIVTGEHKPWGGYSHTLPIWVCAAQRGRDFEAADLERGIHFRGVF